MEKFCKECGKAFEDLQYKLCPFCGGELDIRYGRQPIPRKLRHEVFKRDGYRCRECGASKDETSLEIDHIVPVARGGTNDIDNLQTLCRECNRMKHTDEWVGGEDDLEVAKNELDNLQSQLCDAERKLKSATNNGDIIEYKFKIKKLNHLIQDAQNKFDELKHKAEIAEAKRQVQIMENKMKDILFKKLYVELGEENLSKVCNYFNLNETTDEENLRVLVNNYPREEILKVICFIEIDELNVTTESLYDLEGHNVLIILKDGTNLTNWDNVVDKNDIIYIIEDISNFTNLNNKYENLKSLKSIMLLGTTNQITSMESMFAGCESLVDISSLANFDVSNVENMNNMFYYCESLMDISALSNWDVSNVENMNNMFYQCESLMDISALSNWNVSNVKFMVEMFCSCESLRDISPLKNWNLIHIENMEYMFKNCISLNDVSIIFDWRDYNLDIMPGIFYGCISLNNIPNIPIKNYASLFLKKSSPLVYELNNFEELNKKTHSIYDLEDYEVLIILKDGTNITNWDEVTDKEDIIYFSENLSNEEIFVERYMDFNNLKVCVISGISNKDIVVEGMFKNCSSLLGIFSLDLEDTSNIFGMDSMFECCSSLEDISALASWDMSNVEFMMDMFRGCSSITDISALASWDMSNVKDVKEMFRDCESLADIRPLSNWNISSKTRVKAMFYGCKSLEYISPLYNWDVLNCDESDEVIYKMFSSPPS